MVSSVSRNWFSGLSSGLDTQGLIDKIMTLERIPIGSLEKKRNTLSTQKLMLQEINLKLFETQNKATDLTFSRVFSSKKVSTSDDKFLTATANTSSKVGSYTVAIKQLATATKLTSTGNLSGAIELGQNIQSEKTIGGGNLTLGAPGKGLGIDVGDIEITIEGVPHTLDLASNLTPNSTLNDAIIDINGQINMNADLAGKVKASYDTRTNQLKFTLLDSTKTISVSDIGPGNLVQNLFGSSSISLDKNLPVRGSSTTIRSGTNVTIDDLNFTLGATMVTWDGNSQVLDTSAISGSTTMSGLIENLNHQLDTGYGWSGNPADRKLEFRFNEASQKLILANKNTGDVTPFSIGDVTDTSDLANRIFGDPTVNSVNDQGTTLSQESFASNISSGKFTVDGVQISVNTADTLQGVLSRITSSTNINAEYDAANDVIKLTRKDGSNSLIGLGASSDTSNFLSVTALLSSSQQAPAEKQTQGALAGLDPNLELQDPTGLNLASDGSLKFTINGVEKTFSYQATETLNQVLDRMKLELEGIGNAYFDSSTGKITISTSQKGSTASLKIEDSSGTLATALDLDQATTATGLAVGKTLESSRGISGIKSSAALSSAGFLTPVSGGSFTINGVLFTINTGMTLSSVLQTINNNSKVGVKAEYDSTSGKLSLTSKTTGSSSISLGATTDTSNFLTAAGLTYGSQSVGQNAVFSVDTISGGADLVRSTNSVSDVIEGVTLNFKAVTTGIGETITIKSDTETARKAIDDFLKSYNETTQLIYDKLTEKRDYTMEGLTEDEKKALTTEEVATYEASFQIGLLSGDSTLKSVRGRMRGVMSSNVSGIDAALKSLADLGITTGVVGSSYQDTQVGLLKITDEDKLTQALESDPDKVAALFNNDSSTEGAIGIARRLKNSLNEFTRTGGLLTQRVGRSGTTTNSQFDKQIALLNTQIATQETRLNSREEALIKQFSDLETAMSRYKSQSDAFTSQLSQLTGSS